MKKKKILRLWNRWYKKWRKEMDQVWELRLPYFRRLEKTNKHNSTWMWMGIWLLIWVVALWQNSNFDWCKLRLTRSPLLTVEKWSCILVAVKDQKYQIASKLLKTSKQTKLVDSMEEISRPIQFYENKLILVNKIRDISNENGDLLTRAIYYQYQITGKWNLNDIERLKEINPNNQILGWVK